MGDKPAGTIASSALRKTAEMKEDEFPEAADVIINSSHMDGIIDDVDTLDRAHTSPCKRMVISFGCRVTSIELQLFEAENDLERVLGILWYAKGDYFSFIVKLNFSKKKNNVRIDPGLDVYNVERNIPSNLTKRMVLSQVNGIYDPLGLVAPFVINR